MHRYPSCDGKTPLLCTAEAGHDEIVAYLLQFRTVRTDLESESGTVKTVKVSYSLKYTYCIGDYKSMFVYLFFPAEH